MMNIRIASNTETVILRFMAVAMAIALLYFGFTRMPNLYLESEVNKTLFLLTGLPIIFAIFLLIEFGYSVYRYYKPKSSNFTPKAISSLPLFAKISILISSALVNILPYYLLLRTTLDMKSLTVLLHAYETAPQESKAIIFPLIRNLMENNPTSITMFLIVGVGAIALCALLTPIALDIVFSTKWGNQTAHNTNPILSPV